MDKRACPSKSQIVSIIKSADYPIYRDELGRQYGFASHTENNRSDELIKLLIDTGEIDEQSTFLMWIWLPFHKRGVYTRSKDTRDNLDGDEILFPEVGDIVEVENTRNVKQQVVLRIDSYPEIRKRSKRGRTDLLIAQLF